MLGKRDFYLVVFFEINYLEEFMLIKWKEEKFYKMNKI